MILHFEVTVVTKDNQLVRDTPRRELATIISDQIEEALLNDWVLEAEVIAR